MSLIVKVFLDLVVTTGYEMLRERFKCFGESAMK